MLSKFLIRNCALLILITLWSSFPALSAWAQVDGSSSFKGRWISVIVSDMGEIANGCHYVEVERRGYDLGRDADGKAIGMYTLSRQRNWISKRDPNCRIPEAGLLSDAFLRLDRWSVVGSLDATGRLVLSAVHLSCLGDCNGPPVSDQFETVLVRHGTRVLDLGENRPGEALVFRPQAEEERDEREGALAVSELIQPLIDRDCNRYFRNSLDPSSRLIGPPQDVFCRAIQPIASIISSFTVDQPSITIVASIGSVIPAAAPGGVAAPLLLADDPLVQRALGLPDGSGSILVTVILRRQPDGSWKIRALL